MGTTVLVRREAIVACDIVAAGSCAAQMNDRSQLLFLVEGGTSIPDQPRDISVEQRGGHLHGMAGNDSAIETIEPTGIEIVPRSLFDDDMVVDAIAFCFLERAVGDLKHPDGR